MGGRPRAFEFRNTYSGKNLEVPDPRKLISFEKVVIILGTYAVVYEKFKHAVINLTNFPGEGTQFKTDHYPIHLLRTSCRINEREPPPHKWTPRACQYLTFARSTRKWTINLLQISQTRRCSEAASPSAATTYTCRRLAVRLVCRYCSPREKLPKLRSNKRVVNL